MPSSCCPPRYESDLKRAHGSLEAITLFESLAHRCAGQVPSPQSDLIHRVSKLQDARIRRHRRSFFSSEKLFLGERVSHKYNAALLQYSVCRRNHPLVDRSDSWNTICISRAPKYVVCTTFLCFSQHWLHVLAFARADEIFGGRDCGSPCLVDVVLARTDGGGPGGGFCESVLEVLP